MSQKGLLLHPIQLFVQPCTTGPELPPLCHLEIEHEIPEEDQTAVFSPNRRRGAGLNMQNITEISGSLILLLMGLLYIWKINLI